MILHGMLDSSEGWTRLCEHVPARCIAFDLAGFGFSDAPVEGSIDGYAQDVAEGLAQLGVSRFTLVGHSLGGAVATAITELLPNQVDALVLLAPAGFGRIRMAEAVSIPGVRNVVQAALPHALCSRLAVTAGYLTMITSGQLPERDLLDRVTGRGHMLVDGAREATRAVVQAGRDDRAFHRRQLEFAGPVFAVWGDRDRLVPVAHRDGVLAAFPHAQVQIWKGMGHHALKERFDELVGVVNRAGRLGRRRADAAERIRRAA